MLSIIARCNRSSLVVASATVATVVSTSCWQKKDTDSAVKPDAFSECLAPLGWASASNCLCEALKLPTIQRRQTMAWLENTSSKATLETRYKVDWKNPLGEGGYGAVFLAEDRETGDKRALKMIPKAFTDEDSFNREMGALLRIRECGSHPNICRLTENFEQRGNYYLVMDLIQGGEMFDHLASNGAYSEMDAARLIGETASALAFLHGVGLVHADLKPENLMLSTRKKTNSVIKLVDFGCTEVYKGHDVNFKTDREKVFNTQAYSPPEAFRRYRGPILPSFDMWSMGCILYIMLVGRHPFDPYGTATDEEIQEAIERGAPQLRNSPLTRHLSDSAIELLENLMTYRPRKRMTALQMLEHPWVKGKTAKTEKMKGSDERLKAFRRYKSRLEVKIFSDWIADASSDAAKKTSLMERAFISFDTTGKGYVTAGDISRSLTGRKEGENCNAAISLSGFADLLSDNMENKHYSEGHRIYKEGAKGDAIYFINSGTVEVSTKSGFTTTLSQGQMFGEAALLDDNARRSATITCRTPVHVVRISKDFYKKYMMSADDDTHLTLREQSRARERDRALKIMRLQKRLVERSFVKGDVLFAEGEEGKTLFILDEGNVKILGDDIIVPSGEVLGEHALLTGLPRNATGVCDSDVCKVYEMSARDFSVLLRSNDMKKSFRDICFRRDFHKALVEKFGKDFGKNDEDLRKAFDSMDLDKSGNIGLDEVKELFQMLYPNLKDDDPIYAQALQSLDLKGNELISFEEFKKIFSTH